MPNVNDLREIEKARLREALLRARREERVSPKVRRTVLAMAATNGPPSPSGTDATSARPTPSSSGAIARLWPASWKIAGLAVLGALAVTTLDATQSLPPESVVTTDEPSAPAALEHPRSDREESLSLEPSAAPAPIVAAVESQEISVDDLPPTRANDAVPSKVANPGTLVHVSREPVRVASAATTPTPSGGSPSVTTPSVTTPSGDMRIAEQIRIVEASRAALHAGDPLKALDWLDTYDTEFPKGALHEEAIVLRIESFVRTGRYREATERANAFLESRPKSPYAARVRDSLSAAGR